MALVFFFVFFVVFFYHPVLLPGAFAIQYTPQKLQNQPLPSQSACVNPSPDIVCGGFRETKHFYTAEVTAIGPLGNEVLWR